MSIVRDNLMSRPGYSPYCGNTDCLIMPRTTWTGEQFKCHCCNWASAFPADFIDEYKAKWHDRPQHANPPADAVPCGTHPDNDGLEDYREPR